MNLEKKTNKPQQAARPMRKINGWTLWENDGTGRSEFIKPFVVFHPMYDGIYYEQFDTVEEANAFCTEERFLMWERNLL